MQLSSCRGTLQLLPIQQLLLQLLNRLKQPNSEGAGPCNPICCPTFLPWNQAVALGERSQDTIVLTGFTSLPALQADADVNVACSPLCLPSQSWQKPQPPCGCGHHSR